MATTNLLSVHNAQESLADDAEYSIPITGEGFIFAAAEDDEAGMWAIEASGNVVKASGSTNTAAADTDGSLCVYDSSGTVKVKNRLAATKTVSIIAFIF